MVGNIAILGKAGDTKITWNNENDLEVSRARKEFERLKGLGYKAYKVLDKAGAKGGSFNGANRNGRRFRRRLKCRTVILDIKSI
jgi:hypothetical protein